MKSYTHTKGMVLHSKNDLVYGLAQQVIAMTSEGLGIRVRVTNGPANYEKSGSVIDITTARVQTSWLSG